MITVRDNPDAHRYEIHEDGELAGFSDYRLMGSKMSIVHTEVDTNFSGRGLARTLVTELLDDVRRRELGVLPFCPYVHKVISKDPGRYLDLVPLEDRDRFELPAGPHPAP